MTDSKPYRPLHGLFVQVLPPPPPPPAKRPTVKAKPGRPFRDKS